MMQASTVEQFLDGLGSPDQLLAPLVASCLGERRRRGSETGDLTRDQRPLGLT